MLQILRPVSLFQSCAFSVVHISGLYDLEEKSLLFPQIQSCWVTLTLFCLLFLQIQSYWVTLTLFWLGPHPITHFCDQGDVMPWLSEFESTGHLWSLGNSCHHKSHVLTVEEVGENSPGANQMQLLEKERWLGSSQFNLNSNFFGKHFQIRYYTVITSPSEYMHVQLMCLYGKHSLNSLYCSLSYYNWCLS